MSEIIDAPVRGDLPALVRDFRRLCPDAVLQHVAHDDGCPTISEYGDWKDCSCEMVELHVEGEVPYRVAW